MAFGAATIISKQSGVAEVIKNAIAVDFWDIDKTTEAIVRLLKNPKERESLARAGRLEVRAIEWKRAAEEVHAVYKDVVCST
jgi:glycogen(starch) synthase